MLERWQVWVLAVTILCAGLTVAGGTFLGEFALGDRPAPPPQTALAEKTYTVEELRAALDGYLREDVEIVDGVAVLEPKRKNATYGASVLQWLDAHTRVEAEYELGDDNGAGTTG